MIKTIDLNDVPAAIDEEWRQQQRDLLDEGDRLYATYVRPLERRHWGEYAAVSHDGRVLLGTDLDQLTDRATDQLGRCHFAFKIGEKAVYKVR